MARLQPLLALAAGAVALFLALICVAPAGATQLEQSAEPPPRLIRSQTDVFLVTGRFRRWVVSPQVFADYRFSEAWVERFTDDELTRIPRGPDLIAGPLLRAPGGDLWVVIQGSRRRVTGPDALRPLNLGPDDALLASEAQLASYPEGRDAGNAPRPWMVGVVLGFAAAGVALWWRDAAWPAIAVFVAASTALRLYFALLYPWTHDGADADSYVTTARYLLAGNSLFAPDPAGTLTNTTSPLYPMILAALAPLNRITGGVVGWKVAQVCVTALLALVTADLTRRVFGSRAARMACIVTALSPAWFYSGELLQYELWLALLIVGALWAFVRAMGSARSARWLLSAGALYGLAAFMQIKVAVLLAPAALVACNIVWRRPDWLGWRRPSPGGVRSRGVLAIFAAALLLAPASLPAGAWAARNLALYGEPVVGSVAGGVIFWMGNHENATGGIMQVPRPQAYYERVAKYPETLLTRDARAYSELAWEFIQRRPWHFSYLALMKLERFWWTVEPDRLGSHVQLRTEAFLGGVVDRMGILTASKLLHAASLLTAAAGALWSGRVLAVRLTEGVNPAGGARRTHVRGEAGRALLLGSIALFWLVHIPFISEPRYRLPILPLIHVFEGVGLALLWIAIRRWLPLKSRNGRAITE